MSFLQCSFKSEVLGMEQALNVIIPQIPMNDVEKKNRVKEKGFPVLYLLHGLSDDHSGWMRKSNIERYAKEYDLAVVMPNANQSFYADMSYGLNYYTYITKEIPDFINTYFPISPKREDNFIAGLSMGGYGAFMIALRNPEKYSAAASLSGALDLSYRFDVPEDQLAAMTKILFGSKEEFLNSDYNILRLLEKLQNKKENLPRLFQCCGTEDFVHPLNQTFRAEAEKYRIPVTYEEGLGDHEWGYWDYNIQRVIKWIFGDL